MTLRDVIALLLFAVAVVILALAGAGVSYGHIGALRMSWWALASGFAGLLVLTLPPVRPPRV